MKLEVLVPTINEKDPIKLLERMNIKTDAIICNQTSYFSYEDIEYKNKKIGFYSFNERGVGLNRNNALMRSKADFCIIADDDLIFKDNYEEIVYRNFQQNKDADVLIFNIIEKVPERYIIKRKFRVHHNNYMRFGAARVVIKRNSVIKNDILFNLNFGGGSKYSAGEDTIFLNNCLKKGLKIIAVPDSIAKLNDTRPSTWFEGFNKKYFKDRGALYCALYPNLAKIISIQFLLRHKKMFKNQISLSEAYKYMKLGIKEYKDF